jgi:hypothetical protein
MFFYLEIFRTIDDSATLYGAHLAEKQRKYFQLCRAIAEAMPGFAIHMRKFVIGVWFIAVSVGEPINTKQIN